jgi:beta-lactamase class A
VPLDQPAAAGDAPARSSRRLFASFLAAVSLASCVSNDALMRPPASAASAPLHIQIPPRVPPGAVPQPPASLAHAIEALGRSFEGKVGIAVRDVQAGWTVSFNGDAAFPQQSVSKLWVALTTLDAVDRKAISLSQPVRITRQDLTLFHQPIAANVGADGYVTTVEALLSAAMTRSDNTANDSLLRTVGGPGAVRTFLARQGVTGIAFSDGERLMQSKIAGLEWRQDYSLGRGFYAARDRVPLATRTAALERYLAAPYDGAQPIAVVSALARLRKGELLSPGSTQLLLSLMTESRTGPQRLRGGTAPGWGFGHKTGTGQVLGGLATGYNDVGLLTSPDGRTYAVSVFIASTRQPIPARMQLMQNVTRAIVAQEDRKRQYPVMVDRRPAHSPASDVMPPNMGAGQ